MKKLFILALLCALLSSCNDSSQYQVMFDNGEVVWAYNDNKLDVPSGDTVIIQNLVSSFAYSIYYKYTVWGYYKGVLPPESIDTDSMGNRRSRTWYKAAVVIK